MITIKNIREPILTKQGSIEYKLNISRSNQLAGDLLSEIMKRGFIADVEVKE